MNSVYLYDNDVVEFTYNGGSNPGSVRHVCVICHEGNLVRCWDFDKGERRTFDDRKIENVELCADTKYCDGRSLPLSVTPDMVESGFQSDGYNTFRTDKDWIIAVKLKQPIPVSMTAYQTYKNKKEVYLNVGDRCVGFYVDGDELTIQGSCGAVQYKNPTVAQLKEVLATLGL